MIKKTMTIQEYLSWRNIFPSVVTIDLESCTNAYEFFVARLVNGLQLYGSYENTYGLSNDKSVYDRYNIYSTELKTMIDGEFGFIREHLEKISKDQLLKEQSKRSKEFNKKYVKADSK